MKQIKELTKEELINLTEEQRNDIIDYECALAGIKLLEEPIKPQYDKPKKDIKIYKIGNFVFDNMNDAQKIYSVLTSMNLYQEKSKDYTNYWLAPLKENEYGYPEINISSIYSKELYDSIELNLIKYKNESDDYNIKKDEFDNNQTDVNEIKDKLYDQIKWANMYVYNVENYTRIFNRYLELANGDLSIAKKFLLNAYPDAKDYPEIKSLYNKEVKE